MKKPPYAPLADQLAQPPTYWRSVDHKEESPVVTGQYDVEFPNGVAPVTVSRREVLKLAGAAFSLGALAGCEIVRRPVDEILPFVKQPTEVVPGVRMYYATAAQRSEGALGLIVEANQGRPTKIEGNPNHPDSLGASDIWAQAEVLKLYDPNRARSPMQGTQATTWEKLDAALTAALAQSPDGQGVFLLCEHDLGPTAERLLKAFVTRRPKATVARYDPLAPTQQLAGAELAFGPGARVHFDLTSAKVVFALDSNFLVEGPEHLKLARQFGKTRAVHGREDLDKMMRLYAAEPVFSTTGSNADHRLRVASSQGVDVLRALAAALSEGGLSVPAAGKPGPLPETAAPFVRALAKDLLRYKGAAAILVGERQPAAVHALAYAINAALGGTQTVSRSDLPAGARLPDLAKALDAGGVQTLVILDQNPVYTAPGALRFGDALKKAKASFHFGVLPEETGLQTTWHAPLAHFLEAWGDARAWNGTASLVQPLILPIHGARPLATVLANLAGEAKPADREQVEATWRGSTGALADDKRWRKALHDGVVTGTARALGAAPVRVAEVSSAVSALKGVAPTVQSLELVASQSHALDGRLSNVSWVMELPDSMSKLAWDNAVLMAPATARELAIGSKVDRNGYRADVVELSANGRNIQAPVFVLPGLSPTTLVMTQGYGRSFGDVAKGYGVDVHPILESGSVVTGVTLRKTGETRVLASTQDHFSVPANPIHELTFAQASAEPAGSPDRALGLGTRPLVRSADAREARENPGFAEKGNIPEKLVQLGTPKNRPSKPIQPTDEIVYEGQQWGMVVDLSSCIGCNVCAIACQAENNIPNVGREQVLLGREMHWMRVDRYFTGDVDTPSTVHQPMACQHCENAPCEPVCPVSATTHDEEGLNSMAYNRCIGTRYCANNCPYKVRRFNYLDYTHTGNLYVEPEWTERMRTLKLQRNPDVTVRYRGVMEKCTYCTQRIEEAKISAKRDGEDRKNLPDGAVTPACAQACPTQAITFGNINDDKSRIHALKQSERNYELLQELNVRPRTTYLARVRNENEELG